MAARSHRLTRKEVLYTRTREKRFTIGAFNVDNQETLIAIARAAAARKSPVLVEASHGEQRCRVFTAPLLLFLLCAE